MSGLPEQVVDADLQQEMMLKLITKGFYRELMNYGITKQGVVSVSSFLLENLLKDLKNPSSNNGDEYYNHQFNTN